MCGTTDSCQELHRISLNLLLSWDILFLLVEITAWGLSEHGHAWIKTCLCESKACVMSLMLCGPQRGPALLWAGQE